MKLINKEDKNKPKYAFLFSRRKKRVWFCDIFNDDTYCDMWTINHENVLLKFTDKEIIHFRCLDNNNILIFQLDDEEIARHIIAEVI